VHNKKRTFSGISTRDKHRITNTQIAIEFVYRAHVIVALSPRPACVAHTAARARATPVRRPRARDARTTFHRPRVTLRARSNASIAA
jgi:hypothetical protein